MQFEFGAIDAIHMPTTSFIQDTCEEYQINMLQEAPSKCFEMYEYLSFISGGMSILDIRYDRDEYVTKDFIQLQTFF